MIAQSVSMTRSTVVARLELMALTTGPMTSHLALTIIALKGGLLQPRQMLRPRRMLSGASRCRSSVSGNSSHKTTQIRQMPQTRTMSTSPIASTP